ncbi:MAG: hypothetical protein CM15mP119_1970 [Alphaproteobacteria bacterium]|nr:MAG: hypothetical protein CM15mP119_1970 [Alphaproteobacteria bacterium]
MLHLPIPGLSACTTYIEDRASAEFEPVFPTVDLVADSSNKTGAIYEQGQSGLFSADRRARKVGDILTVDFNEVFAATKAQSAASSKADSIIRPTSWPAKHVDRWAGKWGFGCSWGKEK